jgi:hypothetical protein
MSEGPKNACGVFFIERKKTTQAFAALDLPLVPLDEMGRRTRDDLAFSLVRTFSVIMRSVLFEDMPQRVLSKENTSR